jgi:hypothetical protein
MCYLGCFLLAVRFVCSSERSQSRAWLRSVPIRYSWFRLVHCLCFFSFFPGIFFRERRRDVFFVFGITLSSFLVRLKLLLILGTFYIVGRVITVTVDTFWGDFISQLAVPGEMVPGTFYAFGPCVTVGGCVPPSLAPVTLYEYVVVDVALPAYLGVKDEFYLL